MVRSINRQQTRARPVPHSKRNHQVNHLSSLDPGVVHPIGFFPGFREDSCTGKVEFVIEQMESKELIANPVWARVSFYAVPRLAFPRFQGSRDQFDRSFMGKPKTDDPGETVTPYFTTQVYGDVMAMPLFKAAGKHYRPTDAVNTDYVEAYNLVHNYRLRNKSKELQARLMNEVTLAPAFWEHTFADLMAPSFDEAAMHGEVAISVVEAKLAVKGIGTYGSLNGAATANVRESGSGTGATSYAKSLGTQGNGLVVQLKARQGSTTADEPDIYALLKENGLSFTLANLNKAKNLQGWAEIRKGYEGHDDDEVIDLMLMAGLSIEDQWLKDPILLDTTIVQFRQAKRYSTTAGDLDDSAVSGVAAGSCYLRMPRIPVGAIIVGICEILPEQLWERRADPYMFIDDARELPDALLDQADPIKVDVVTNRMVDVAHSAPDATFAYEPKNARYTSWGPTVGGDFIRPAATTGNTAARQRIWAVEAVDPALTDDFFIAKDGIHKKPFIDPVLQPYQIQVKGNLVFDGLTQFGGLLVEATGNYEKLVEHTQSDDNIQG